MAKRRLGRTHAIVRRAVARADGSAKAGSARGSGEQLAKRILTRTHSVVRRNAERADGIAKASSLRSHGE
jgi:hypothetical protein